jgi:small subunit ribosomal protein S16
MLVIRLARGGRSKYPVYRIVAAESARAATGKFIEVLGHYNPHSKELSLKKEEIANRLKHGAQPSNSVIKLLQREKVELPAWVKLEEKTRKPKNAPEEPKVVAEAAADEVSAEPETPAVEEAAAVVDAPAIDASDTKERVATVASANEAEVSDNAPSKATETAESTEAAAEKATAASEAGAVATDKAAETTSKDK